MNVAMATELPDGVLAKHAGTCPICQEPITRGDLIVFFDEEQWVHEDCARRELEGREAQWIIERYEADGDTDLLAQLIAQGVIFRINHLVLHELGLSIAVERHYGEPVGIQIRRARDARREIAFDVGSIEIGRDKLRRAGLLGTVHDLSAEEVADFRIHEERNQDAA